MLEPRGSFALGRLIRSLICSRKSQRLRGVRANANTHQLGQIRRIKSALLVGFASSRSVSLGRIVRQRNVDGPSDLARQQLLIDAEGKRATGIAPGEHCSA